MILNFLTRAYEYTCNMVFPPHCLICGSYYNLTVHGWLCHECTSEIKKLPEKVCLKCSRPLIGSENDDDCAVCRGSKRLLQFDSSKSFGVYDGKLRDMILAFKFSNRKVLCRDLAEMIKPSFIEMNTLHNYTAIVPVPLHKNRLVERGYNQSELLGKELSKVGNIPTKNLLRRKKDTKYQSELTPNQRYDNILNAFEYSGESSLKNEVILLVDDIMSTCSTVSECAKVLKKNRAIRVDVLTIAR